MSLMETAKSKPYKITMKNGDMFVGFILVNETDLGMMVVLLYSSIHDSKPAKLNDTPSGTDWKTLFYSDIESVNYLRPYELKG